MVFVSYARTDEKFVRMLAEELQAAGIAIWIDQSDIQGGQRWYEKVQEGLAYCEQMVLVVSPNSVDSKNVKDEVNFFIKNDKVVTPILYRDCTLPYWLESIQRIDFRSDYQDSLGKLVETLRANESVQGRPLAAPERPNNEKAGYRGKLRLRPILLFAAITMAASLLLCYSALPEHVFQLFAVASVVQAICLPLGMTQTGNRFAVLAIRVLALLLTTIFLGAYCFFWVKNTMEVYHDKPRVVIGSVFTPEFKQMLDKKLYFDVHSALQENQGIAERIWTAESVHSNEVTFYGSWLIFLVSFPLFVLTFVRLRT